MARKQADGFEGYCTYILMQDGIQMKFKVKWAPGDIKVCINCNVIPSTVYKLQCSHKLCNVCFYGESFYVCPMDNVKSENYKVVPFTSPNSGLITTTVECPFCGTVHKCLDIEDHIETSHPEKLRKMQLSSPGYKLSGRPSTVGPPPGFEGHQSTVGRGRGLLNTTEDAYRIGHKRYGYQQVLKGAKFASLGTTHEDMETEEIPRSIDQPTTNESLKTVGDTSSDELCLYCEVPVKSDDREKHLKHCSDAFFRWKKVILGEVFQDSRKDALAWQSKFPRHGYACPVLDVECKRCFMEMMCNYSREHPADQCLASKPGSLRFQEHVINCPKFFITSREFITRVVDKYRQDHFRNGCPGTKQSTKSHEGEVSEFWKTQPSTSDASTKQEEDTALCPNCFDTFKIEDVADHAENCPKLLVCEKCSIRVVAEDYDKHLNDECPSNKQGCTRSQVDDDKGPQTSTKSTTRGTQYDADDSGAGSTACPYCQILWDNEDLQEHTKNCLRDRYQAFLSESDRMDHSGQHSLDASLHEGKSDATYVKKPDEDNEIPKNEEDDVEALKKRLDDMERWIGNVDQPLTRLIESLRKNE